MKITLIIVDAEVVLSDPRVPPDEAVSEISSAIVECLRGGFGRALYLISSSSANSSSSIQPPVCRHMVSRIHKSNLHDSPVSLMLSLSLSLTHSLTISTCRAARLPLISLSLLGCLAFALISATEINTQIYGL
jgi:hypothetical protein